MNKILTLKLLFLISLALPAYAHHSHAMFDHENEMEISGNVIGFHFANPHSMLYVEVEDQAGSKATWSIEMGPISFLIEDGINRNTYQSGDMARIKIHPLRNGDPGGNLVETLSVMRNGAETILAD
jgi:hypothetical protein